MKNARIVALTLLFVLAAALFAGCSEKTVETPEQIAAMVNSQKIYYSDVNEYYSAYMSPGDQVSLGKSGALSLVIEREVLYQEAVKQGFVASEKEIANQYQAYISSSNISESKLKKDLVLSGLTLSDFKLDIGKRIAITKLLDSVIPSQFIIKHEDAEAVYNSSEFRLNNVSYEEAEQRIVDALTELKRSKAEEKYINGLKDKANVRIVSVPD
jgi:hypothetical protein